MSNGRQSVEIGGGAMHAVKHRRGDDVVFTLNVLVAKLILLRQYLCDGKDKFDNAPLEQLAHYDKGRLKSGRAEVLSKRSIERLTTNICRATV
jgi:hypothetical protein